jgi:hypothetical protein
MRKNQVKDIENCLIKDLSTIDIDTKEKAYVFGLLNADGYIQNNALWLYSVDEDFIEFKKLIEKVFVQANYYHRTLKGNRKPQSCFHVHSRHLIDKLVGMDFDKKSIFMVDYNLPEELIPYYLLGYFDGDGCFFIKSYSKRQNDKPQFLRQFNVSSGYDFDWSYLEKILNKHNINYKVVRYKYPKSAFSRIVVTKKDDLVLLIKYLYQDLSFPSLSRKKEKAMLIVKNIEECKTKPKKKQA